MDVIGKLQCITAQCGVPGLMEDKEVRSGIDESAGNKSWDHAFSHQALDCNRLTIGIFVSVKVHNVLENDVPTHSHHEG